MKMLRDMTAPDTALFRAVDRVFKEAEKEGALVEIKIKWPRKPKVKAQNGSRAGREA